MVVAVVRVAAVLHARTSAGKGKAVNIKRHEVENIDQIVGSSTTEEFSEDLFLNPAILR